MYHMDEINAWKSIYICIGFTRKTKDRLAHILVNMYVLYEEIGINERTCFTCHPVLALVIP